MASKRKGGASTGTEIALPITPMLDMSFQLLFFFITTFKLPTGMEGTLDLNLPSESTPAADTIQNIDPNKTSDTDPPDLKSEITISVQSQKTDAQSNDSVISLITIEESSGKTPIPPPYKSRLDELTSRLKDIGGKGDKPPAVKIEGDDYLKWRDVVKVMDACRNAGLTNVSFAQPPDYATYGHN